MPLHRWAPRLQTPHVSKPGLPPSFLPPAGRLPCQTQHLRFPPPYAAMAEIPDSMARAAVLFEDGWTLTVWHTVEVHSWQSDLTAVCGIPHYVRVNFRFEGEMWPQWDACFGIVALNDVPDSPEQGCAETSISWVSLTGAAVDRGTYTHGKAPGTFKENLPWAIIESFKMTGLFQVQTRSGAQRRADSGIITPPESAALGDFFLLFTYFLYSLPHSLDFVYCSSVKSSVYTVK